MKRSEMVKLLEQHLLEDHGLDFLTDKPIVVAEEIVNFLETKGMRIIQEDKTNLLKDILLEVTKQLLPYSSIGNIEYIRSEIGRGLREIDELP